MIEGQGCGQYGEDRILSLVFQDRPTGLVVDVGAADGWANSNSIGLLKRPGWEGVLIEPLPEHFKELYQRYRDRPKTLCINTAIGRVASSQTFYCYGQVSTFKKAVKKSAEDQHGVVYSEIQMDVGPLSPLLLSRGINRPIDFLTIDAEGMDYEVWQTVDTSVHSPGLVLLEGAGYKMSGYRELARVGGNTFYLREDLCGVL